MKRLNRVIFNEDLQIDTTLSVDGQTNVYFRQFSSSVNVIEVFVPLSSDYIFYGLARTRSNEIKHRTADRHRGKYVRSEMIDGNQYAVYEFKPLSFVFSVPTATELDFTAEFQFSEDEDYLGAEYALGDVNDWLKGRFPEAEQGNFVRVVSEDEDWEFDGTDWVALEDKRSHKLFINKSEMVTWSVESNQDAGWPEHDPTATELIFAELDDRPTATEIAEEYYNKIQSDDRFANKDETDTALDDLETDKLNRSGTPGLTGNLDANQYGVNNLPFLAHGSALSILIDGTPQITFNAFPTPHQFANHIDMMGFNIKGIWELEGDGGFPIKIASDIDMDGNEIDNASDVKVDGHSLKDALDLDGDL